MEVDLGGAAKNDAILIDDVNLAGGVHGTEDLGGVPAQVGDEIECDPFTYVGASFALVESQGGVAANVERIPIENRVLGCLDDCHGCLIAGSRLSGCSSNAGP